MEKEVILIAAALKSTKSAITNLASNLKQPTGKQRQWMAEVATVSSPETSRKKLVKGQTFEMLKVRYWIGESVKKGLMCL